MKKSHSKLVSWPLATLAIATLALSTFAACKKEEDPELEKKLVKEKLYDKRWYNQGNTRSYYFNSNGYIGTIDKVTPWEWHNDTLHILHTIPGVPTEKLIIEWTTDNEMSCRRPGDIRSSEFRTSMW